MKIGLINTAKQWARTIKRDVHAVWLASSLPFGLPAPSFWRERYYDISSREWMAK